MVRAINYCIVANNQTACIGDFSDTSVFAARAPRVPLPPAMPYRSSASDVATPQITIRWFAPVDNGGSPITKYTVWFALPNTNSYIRTDVAVPTAQATELSKATTDLVLTYTQGSVAAPLTAGAVYRFYITATNTLGDSAASPVLAVAAGNPPGMTNNEVLAYNQVQPSILSPIYSNPTQSILYHPNHIVLRLHRILTHSPSSHFLTD